MATLHTLFLQKLFIENPGMAKSLTCITFAAPHVGDFEFVKDFIRHSNHEIFGFMFLRVINVQDSVPKLLGNFKNYRQIPNTLELHSWGRGKLTDTVHDHYSRGYEGRSFGLVGPKSVPKTDTSDGVFFEFDGSSYYLAPEMNGGFLMYEKPGKYWKGPVAHIGKRTKIENMNIATLDNIFDKYYSSNSDKLINFI